MPYHGVFIPQSPEKYLGNAKNIVYRSSWEQRFFRFCDTSPGILHWASEEFCIPYLSPKDHKVHRYFPDVWVEAQTSTGPKGFLIEIKPKAQTTPRKVKRKSQKYLWELAAIAINEAKWNAAREFCKTKNWQFVVLTEDDLFHKGFR